MFRKKKITWWETEPIVSGADKARVRGSHEDSGRHRGPRSPYYGPVAIAGATDEAECSHNFPAG
jgi:hypothetical protein